MFGFKHYRSFLLMPNKGSQKGVILRGRNAIYSDSKILRGLAMGVPAFNVTTRYLSPSNVKSIETQTDKRLTLEVLLH